MQKASWKLGLRTLRRHIHRLVLLFIQGQIATLKIDCFLVAYLSYVSAHTCVFSKYLTPSVHIRVPAVSSLKLHTFRDPVINSMFHCCFRPGSVLPLPARRKTRSLKTFSHVTLSQRISQTAPWTSACGRLSSESFQHPKGNVGTPCRAYI